jgi:hypothetical protein
VLCITKYFYRRQKNKISATEHQSILNLKYVDGEKNFIFLKNYGSKTINFLLTASWIRSQTLLCTCLLPEGALEEKLLELGEETVEDIDLGASRVSDVAERTNDSLPFEMTYAVQKLGMHSEMLVAILLPLSCLKSDTSYKGF